MFEEVIKGLIVYLFRINGEAESRIELFFEK